MVDALCAKGITLKHDYDAFACWTESNSWNKCFRKVFATMFLICGDFRQLFTTFTLLDCFINLVSKFTNNFFGFSQSLNWESIFSNATVFYLQKLLCSQRVESLKLSTQNKNILKDFGRCFNALTIFSCPLSQLQRERVSMLDDPCSVQSYYKH